MTSILLPPELILKRAEFCKKCLCQSLTGQLSCGYTYMFNSSHLPLLQGSYAQTVARLYYSILNEEFGHWTSKRHGEEE